MADDERTCACGCGTPVKGTWVRGHSSRGRPGERTGRLEALPPPGDSFYDDIGELVPDEPGPPRQANPVGAAEPADPSSPPEDAGPVTPDEPPAHARRGWNRQPRGEAKPKPKPQRVTQTIRADIDGKIGLMLEIPGRVWEARDPVCGGTFVAQRPEISAALTDLVCQSPDLINWFTGTGGQFMLWLNVMASLWPVITVIMAHHVYHSIEAGPDMQPETRYAA